MFFYLCFFCCVLFIKLWRCVFFNSFRACAYLGIDLFTYFREKKWRHWNGFGLNIYVGMFGKGKSLAAASFVCRQAKRYNLNVLSNIKLYGVEYEELTNYQQIIEAPADTIILIDEISTLFNARSWKDFNINLLFQLLQCRKNRKQIVATAQRFAHVDKLLRDITFNVIECNKHWRYLHLEFYDGWDYENMMNSNMIKRVGHSWRFIDNSDYNCYDTDEIIDNVKKTDFLSNDEILANRGDIVFNDMAVKKPSRKFGKRMKGKAS